MKIKYVLKYYTILSLICFGYSIYAFEKTVYNFSGDPLDVVIPCHTKDLHNLDDLIHSIRMYVCEARRIIVVSERRFTYNAEWCSETVFPFNKEQIALLICQNTVHAQKELNKKNSRIGWIYQQFIKFYAPFCISGISANVLVVDADVTFLRPIQFLQENGAALYAFGKEYHVPYFVHAQKVLPQFKKLYSDYSGIVHHMVFQKEVLEDLFAHIRAIHQEEPWKVMARFIALDYRGDIIQSGMSEYEMYFNFVFARTDQVKLRHLKWKNDKPKKKKKSLYNNYDFIAVHNYL